MAKASSQSSGAALSVRGIAGTHVVLLALDAAEGSMDDVLGFGVERIDHTSGTRYWMTNNLRFPEARDHWGTNFNPLQTYCWGDYACAPGRTYTYVVHTMVGTPGDELTPRDSTSIRVTTELPGSHGVWFNRGAISSQAYTRLFKNQVPEAVPNRAAWQWLSRGLEEALLAFIGQASDESWTLHGSFYEFEHPSVLRALAVAASVGVDVKLVVDGDEATNHEAVEEHGLEDCVTTWRTKAQIPHNKFLVLVHDGVAEQVWTGSTNITVNGIFGQSNVGHVVRDPQVAASYLGYWHELVADPTPGVLNDWVEVHNELPDTWPPGITVVFSPRQSFAALDRYCEAFGDAAELLCATFAFNLDDRFGAKLAQPNGAVRLLLFEDESKARAAQDHTDDPLTSIAWGSFIPEGALASWAPELENPFSNNIEYVHTKYLLVDPLGLDPLVIAGSANFSEASTNRNDENMLVIRGDTHLADIYFTEFFRLYSHYRFRSSLGLSPTEPSPGAMSGVEAPVPLESTEPWWRKYYSDPGRAAQRRRLAGT